MPRKRELESRFSAFFVQILLLLRSPFLSHIDIYSKSLFKTVFHCICIYYIYIIEYIDLTQNSLKMGMFPTVSSTSCFSLFSFQHQTTTTKPYYYRKARLLPQTAFNSLFFSNLFDHL